MTLSLAGSPAFAAWTATTPDTATSSEFSASGDRSSWCCCCGRPGGELVAATSVISRKFTDADTWVYGGPWLCRACGWAYATTELRRSVYLIDQHPAARTLIDRTRLGELLAAGPLEVTRAVILPVRGRRHILPTAAWGWVCTDDTAMRWDTTAVARLNDLRWLRGLPGIRAAMLTAPVPPMSVMRTQPADIWPELIARWESLRPWRTHPGAWWDAAIALSTPAPVKPRDPYG
ncbi:hypothetical protein [Gordonia amicalis]|uniref:Uncharacterized protein n=1 Tax=Gordonia amicalis TaxID=89053 RepID=A0ABU4DJT4_9ACTN|nr:hypothetical protein [Gordonia amicalis]MDV6310002.1 hypothetical protein [Gordonia amicalis]